MSGAVQGTCNAAGKEFSVQQRVFYLPSALSFCDILANHPRGANVALGLMANGGEPSSASMPSSRERELEETTTAIQSWITSAVQTGFSGLADDLDSRITSAVRRELQQSTHSEQRSSAASGVSALQGEGPTIISTSVGTSVAVSTTWPVVSNFPAASTTVQTVSSLPNPTALAGIGLIQNQPSQVSLANTTAPSLSSLESLISSQCLSAATPLTSLTSGSGQHPTTSAVVLGSTTPPIPRKLAEKVWRGEFVELQEFLPARLGAPEPTLFDLIAEKGAHKAKKSSHAVRSIEQWVVCFNTYVSLIALQQPARVPDLLEYASVIIKASQKFEGLAWLSHDSHFRRMTAATRRNKWAEVDTSLWTLYFGSAKPKQVCKDCFEPGHLYCEMESIAEADTPGKNPKERPLRRQTPYNLPVCLRWNRP